MEARGSKGDSEERHAAAMRSAEETLRKLHTCVVVWAGARIAFFWRSLAKWALFVQGRGPLEADGADVLGLRAGSGPGCDDARHSGGQHHPCGCVPPLSRLPLPRPPLPRLPLPPLFLFDGRPLFPSLPCSPPSVLGVMGRSVPRLLQARASLAVAAGALAASLRLNSDEFKSVCTRVVMAEPGKDAEAVRQAYARVYPESFFLLTCYEVSKERCVAAAGCAGRRCISVA